MLYLHLYIVYCCGGGGKKSLVGVSERSWGREREIEVLSFCFFVFCFDFAFGEWEGSFIAMKNKGEDDKLQSVSLRNLIFFWLIFCSSFADLLSGSRIQSN